MQTNLVQMLFVINSKCHKGESALAVFEWIKFSADICVRVLKMLKVTVQHSLAKTHNSPSVRYLSYIYNFKENMHVETGYPGAYPGVFFWRLIFSLHWMVHWKEARLHCRVHTHGKTKYIVLEYFFCLIKNNVNYIFIFYSKYLKRLLKETITFLLHQFFVI